MTVRFPIALGLAWLCLAAGCGVCAPAAAEEPGGALLIENPATGLHAVLPLVGVHRVTIRFFHSFDRHWVEETFRIADGRFVPVEVAYADDSYDYRDQRYRCRTEVGTENIRLTAIEPRPSDRLTEIRTRVAHTRSQRLILRGAGGEASYLFSWWGHPGEPLVLSVK
jgi:hypothetical protein